MKHRRYKRHLSRIGSLFFYNGGELYYIVNRHIERVGFFLIIVRPLLLEVVQEGPYNARGIFALIEIICVGVEITLKTPVTLLFIRLILNKGVFTAEVHLSHGLIDGIS